MHAHPQQLWELRRGIQQGRGVNHQADAWAPARCCCSSCRCACRPTAAAAACACSRRIPTHQGELPAGTQIIDAEILGQYQGRQLQSSVACAAPGGDDAWSTTASTASRALRHTPHMPSHPCHHACCAPGHSYFQIPKRLIELAEQQGALVKAAAAAEEQQEEQQLDPLEKERRAFDQAMDTWVVRARAAGGGACLCEGEAPLALWCLLQGAVALPGMQHVVKVVLLCA